MAKTEQVNGLRQLRGSSSAADKLTDNGRASSDLEPNGSAIPGETQVDKYGFTGGAQQVSGEA